MGKKEKRTLLQRLKPCSLEGGKRRKGRINSDQHTISPANSRDQDKILLLEGWEKK